MPYRMVYTEFWNDPKVIEEMTPEDKYFYLYLMTNPCTAQIGIYQITKKQMAFDLGYSIESVNSLMDRFIKHHELIQYNSDTRELAIKNWGKYNLNRGGKPVLDCINKELKEVKDKLLITYISEGISNPTIKNVFNEYLSLKDDTYNDTCNDTSTIRGQKEKEKEKEKEKKEEKHTLSQSQSIELYKYIEQITCTPGILNVGAIKLAIIQHGYEYVKKAIDIAVQRDKIDMVYINGILRNWAKEGYPKDEETKKAGYNIKQEPVKYKEFDLGSELL